MRRSIWGTAAAVLVAAVVVGCAPSAAVPNPRPPTASEHSAAPTPTPTPTPAPDPAEAAVDAMTTAEQAASVVMGHISSADPAAVREYMASGLGGFILMGGNIPGDAAQLHELTAAMAIDPELPPLIAIDQEGGVVSRLSWDTLPAGRALQNAPPADTRAAFASRADLVAETGANVNFGIIADVPADPSSFISSRALGTDPEAAAQRVRAAVQGEKGIVLSTLKHFPGHGAAPGDSHHSIPTTSMSLAQWQAGDAKPFIAGIDAGAELLMFGHLAFTSVDQAPASLSSRWHEIARTELGFDGVMITDDLGMLTSSGVAAYRDPVVNAVDALIAGNDMVLMVAGSTAATAPAMVDGIAAAVGDGRLPADRLRDAAVHVMALRLQLAAARSQ
ncbi:Beta-hexosaminidase [Microbacterium esteraromaticum]|uniref:Beta-hexosaminidase n=1 Tax=Microbacterium esteraromaticum TaxID=57043 RepID=A0A1R4KFK2_9MICO|nr:glycoside hydrolase family 3 N-terminal domain-containing protein [Microbacterium esteraromaticum]SJN43110.1 Beta-hexosaminidase [Microbacterium esteraromaticum]